MPPISLTRRRLLGFVSLSVPLAGGCIGPLAGRKRWTFETEGLITGTPAVQDGLVYVGDHDRIVYALSADTGREQWRFETSGFIRTGPTVRRRTVYVTSEDDNAVFALGAETGEKQWVTQFEGTVTSAPTVAGDRLFVGSDTRLHALDAASGDERWRVETEKAFFARSTPIVADGTVFTATTFGALHAFDAETGSRRWQVQLDQSVDSSPAYDSGVVHIATDDNSDPPREGYVYAVDAVRGEQRWRTKLGGSVEGTSPVVRRGTVYVGAWDGAVYALDTESGTVQQRFETAEEVESNLAVTDAGLYVGDNTGKLYAFDLETGEKRWTFQTSSQVVGGPTVAGDAAYVGSHDGTLFAVSL